MTLYKELSYDGDECVSKIKGIQFCIMGPAEIRARSVAEITNTQTYTLNEPHMNGLFDPRMGYVDNNKLCKTCEQRNTFCPGHFGHIELAVPVFFVQFFDHVRKLLRCVCFRCSKILVDLKDPAIVSILSKKHSNQKRWALMSNLCSNVKRCGKETIDGCGARQPDRVAKTDTFKINMEWKGLVEEEGQNSTRSQIFGAEDVLRIFKRITDEDSTALGFCPKFNRPEWMICTVLPVPPPSVRPSVRSDAGVRKEDDLTHKLSDVIKNNAQLKAKIAKGATYEQLWPIINAVQIHVATLIDNSGALVAKDRTGRVFRTICDRLNRKEGRIRGNLMGKRVDFSARTVITPDPNIRIDELGVPLTIAMNLTFPEVVNVFNIEKLTRLVRNGPDVYPGAKHIRKGQRTIRLKGNDLDTIKLEFGDVVERHLCNGDWVLFNRQPSLHKMSMMAHCVRVMPYNTFRLNVCVCASYNADFDGDEMNMHVPQSLQSHEEIMQLAAVQLHIISPRHSQPIITPVQDVALGAFRMTQDHVRVTQKQLFNLISSNPVFSALGKMLDAPHDATWTGRELFSTVLPPTIMLSMFGDKKPDEKGYVEGDHRIQIRCGKLETGLMTTKIFADAAKGLIRDLVREGGSDVAAMFLNNLQKLVCDWLVLNGFSVGISDLVASEGKFNGVKTSIEEMHRGINAKILELHEGRMKNMSTANNRIFFESQIIDVTRECTSKVEKTIFADVDLKTNRMMNMITSGSKGKKPNFNQMQACLGQQYVDSGRVPDGFDSRTLPHFTKYDDGAASRGFIQHSFVEGLSPQEFFFHSMAGRVGLIDTAVRSVTWETAVLVLQEGNPKVVKIGEWIDGLISSERIDSERLDSSYESLDVNDVYVPTVDEDGRVTWAQMTSVTRHDPSESLYRVVTRGGRTVTVAESQSLLVWHDVDKKFLPKDSCLVHAGDSLPVVETLPTPVIIDSIDIVRFIKSRRPSDSSESLPNSLPNSPPNSLRNSPPNSLPNSQFHAADVLLLNLTKEAGILVGLYMASPNDDVRDCREIMAGIELLVRRSNPISVYLDGLSRSNDVYCPHDELEEIIGIFFDEFSRDKGVPDVAYCAPEEFVVGLLTSLLSEGHFTPNGEIVSKSHCAESYALLFNRIGVYAETSSRELKLDAHETRRALAKLDDPGLSQRYSSLDSSNSSNSLTTLTTNFNEKANRSHDVRLDEVVSITRISHHEKKLYDVTVPSTLNFVLANGLGVRDTSETG